MAVLIFLDLEWNTTFYRSKSGLAPQTALDELLVHILQVEILALPVRVKGQLVEGEIGQQHLHVVAAPLHELGADPPR